MANGPPSESFPPWLKPLVTPLIVGGQHFSTRPGAALPHVGSLLHSTFFKGKVKSGIFDWFHCVFSKWVF